MSAVRFAIVDYGIGNLGSVTKAFRHAGAEATLCAEPELLEHADALVLPGDGAFGATLGEIHARGLVRFGHAYVPLDEALSRAVVDLSGRPWLHFGVQFRVQRIGDMPTELFEDFFWALVDHGRFNLHLDVLRGRNSHHIAETLFKATARALAMAVARDPRVVGVPSTKGSL